MGFTIKLQTQSGLALFTILAVLIGQIMGIIIGIIIWSELRSLQQIPSYECIKKLLGVAGEEPLHSSTFDLGRDRRMQKL